MQILSTSFFENLPACYHIFQEPITWLGTQNVYESHNAHWLHSVLISLTQIAETDTPPPPLLLLQEQVMNAETKTAAVVESITFREEERKKKKKKKKEKRHKVGKNSPLCPFLLAKRE